MSDRRAPKVDLLYMLDERSRATAILTARIQALHAATALKGAETDLATVLHVAGDVEDWLLRNEEP